MAVGCRTPVENGCCPAGAIASFYGRMESGSHLEHARGNTASSFQQGSRPGLVDGKKCRKLCSRTESSRRIPSVLKKVQLYLPVILIGQKDTR